MGFFDGPTAPDEAYDLAPEARVARGRGGLEQGGYGWFSAERPEGASPQPGLSETRTPLDVDSVHEAAARAVAIGPGQELDPGPGGETEERSAFVGPMARMVPGMSKPMPYATYVALAVADESASEARSDWEGMVCDDWADLTLVNARLNAGADPDRLHTDPDRLDIDPDRLHTDPDRLEKDDDAEGACEEDRAEDRGNRGRGEDPGKEDCEVADCGVETPLHQAAAHGSGPVVAALARRTADVDARDGDGCTPLWHAVCRGRADVAAPLLAAGADPWRPVIDGRSPGHLALTTPLAPLFEHLPGAVHRTAREQAAQREADRLIQIFEDAWLEGLAAAFVADLDEAETVRRLGADPDACPVPEGRRWVPMER
ncbi:ankyrin repeat domain-containing protein [Streptomyces sp. LX-29]|uniref:ankyrin repeat domain-containing protein n=1 Tax=Streptomyces sp. LX-29 TaxID=2900152 RepID=UPI00240E2909|nr:ankyrin repeat domain-containing protein [Streptomyces sp. LX-29]WFB05939.1 ankyrin repeat domain-containing protein [Streptomyces sp. LX-29]